eukprot:209742-Amphidinium_carterae.1
MELRLGLASAAFATYVLLIFKTRLLKFDNIWLNDCKHVSNLCWFVKRRVVLASHCLYRCQPAFSQLQLSSNSQLLCGPSAHAC